MASKLKRNFLTFLGKIHVPFSHKKVTSDDYYFIRDNLLPGTILVTSTYGEFTNILIKGSWHHAAIVGNWKKYDVEHPYVVEAVGTGVRRRDLIDFCMSKDRIAAVYPLFLDITKRDEYMLQASENAERLIGSNYDFDFTPINSKYYCSELCWQTYQRAVGYEKMPPMQKTRFFTAIVTPEFFIESKEYWKKIWTSEEKRNEIKIETI